MKMLKFRKIIALIVAFQLSTAPFATTYVSAATEITPSSKTDIEAQLDHTIEVGAELPEAHLVREKFEELATEIDNAGERDLPKSTPNAFHLAEQTFTLIHNTDQREFNLSRFNLDLPTVTVNDFQKEIEIEVDRTARTVSFVKNKGFHKARHTIHGIDVVSFARDAELLQMVGSNGLIYAIDLAFASSRYVLFKTPIPVFTVGTVPEALINQVEGFSGAFITEGLRPPTWVHAEGVIPLIDESLFSKNTNNNYSSLTIKDEGQWESGHFVLYTDGRDNKDRGLIGIYRREVTLRSVQLGFGILNSLAYTISPEGQADSAVTTLYDAETSLAISQVNNRLDEITRNAISAYTPQVVAQAEARSNAISARMNDRKHKMLFTEWQAEYNDLHELATKESAADELKAAAQKGDLGQYARSMEKTQKIEQKKAEKTMFERLVTKQGLKTIAAVIAGYTSIVGAHLYGGQLVDGHGPAWAVHAAMSIYDILPAVLKDSAYRVTIFKGIHALSSLLLINYVVGSLVGKARGWDFKKALATMGIRVAAVIQFSFLARLAQLSRQPSFITALRSGTNPFSLIKANSAVGKMAGISTDTRAGVNNPFMPHKKLLSDIEKKRAILEAKISVDRRRNATAALLANLVIAEKFGIDPVTLLMAQNGELDGKNLDELDVEIKRLKTNPVIFEKWKLLAKEVYFALNGIEDFKEDISNIKKERFIEFYEIAKNTAEKMSKRSLFKSVAANLKNKWLEISQGRGLKAVGNFGHTEYDFLKNVDPSKFVSEQSWEQFRADFYLTVLQIPFVGDRAKIDMPHELAHQEGRFMWTSPGHMADMGNQYAIYGITVPARMAQVYGDQAIQTRENRYDPLEMITLESVTKPEGFFRGMWSWMQGASNLKEAGYGYIFVKDFMRRLKAIQLTFSMDIFCRLFIAGQAASSAFPAFAYYLLMAEWSYAWFWKPVTRGNQIYKDGLTKINSEFMDAKIKISQGIRLKNDSLWKEGFSTLLELYSEHTTIEESSAKVIAKIETLLNIPAKDRASEEDIKKIPFMKTLKLRSAIQLRDKNLIRQAYDELKSTYQKNGMDVSPLDAQELLEFSLKNPPFYNSINTKVSNVTNIVASIVTTYLGTNLFVDLLRDHSWSEKITTGALISLSLYVLVYNMQRGIDNVAKTTEYIRLRNQLPLEAFADAENIRPAMNSLEEYAKWIKAQPETSEVIKSASTEDIVSVLTEEIKTGALGERLLLAKINAKQKPTLGEIQGCAALLSNKEATPMTWSEKIKILIKGTFSPPTN